MRLTRVHVAGPLVCGERVRLQGSAASHITRVLRLRVGAALIVFDGNGGEYQGSIDKAHGGEVLVAVGARAETERESPLALTLAQGISRGERMDLVVQKATELGVTTLAPLLTERSVVRLDAAQAARKSDHWRAIARAACEQSGRNRPPRLLPPATLAAFLGAEGGATKLLLSPTAALRLAEIPPPSGEVQVLIGPEGGLTGEEQERAQAAGFLGVRLGP
ncbi:MAG TPA: 16S rRNA (uracil(1498)-N(3))-methyltransferase, partial [Steroidobacteraceae bacterium]|nr:16S rRNA (uracil(1498)-N(3))-methyltransferase [Steroidobacteraceae bacterium]